MARPSSKEIILEAAEAIVLESGAVHMTLDAVAERSGVSKGGLMYNFPTKEALLEAMINRMRDRLNRLREKAREMLPRSSSNELMVEIRMLQGEFACDRRLGVALLAVAANHPTLTRQINEEMRERFFSDIVSQDSFSRSAILYFAALGLHFHDLLNLSLIDNKKMKLVFEELLRLARQDGEFLLQDRSSIA